MAGQERECGSGVEVEVRPSVIGRAGEGDVEHVVGEGSCPDGVCGTRGPEAPVFREVFLGVQRTGGQDIVAGRRVLDAQIGEPDVGGFVCEAEMQCACSAHFTRDETKFVGGPFGC